MPNIPFEITDETAELYVQVISMHGEDDLYATILEVPDKGEPKRVARSDLGRYANSLGPVALTKGKYQLIIHPDIESDDSGTDRTEIFRFVLDALLEK